MTSEQPQHAGKPFVLASCSILPEKWNKEGNAGKMLSFMERSLQCGVDVIAVPEGCLEGYVVMEAIEGKRGPELLNIAEPEDGDMIARFRSFCQKHHVHALLCFCERERNEAFNTALWIGRHGETVGKYPDHRFNSTGNEIRAFDTEFGRAGVMICFDRRVPEVARCLALDGAQFILNPSYGVYKGWNDSILVARAHENQVPVVFVHPSKTLAVNEKGDITFCREETDVISVLTVTPRTSSSLLLSLRRPQLYGRLTSLE